MNLSGEELEKLRLKLRFKVSYEVGFACPDVEDIVQEAIARWLVASQNEKIRNSEAVGAFLNGICRYVARRFGLNRQRHTVEGLSAWWPARVVQTARTSSRAFRENPVAGLRTRNISKT